jgi:hypothetical protein
VALGLAVLLVQGCASVPHPGDSGLSLPGLASFPAEVALVSTHWSASEAAGHGTEPQGRATCGGLVVPPDWPDFSSGDGEALLAPFLTCASPAEFVALQQCVDMPRLLEALDDWRAVLLGALGPVREDAAHLLQRKRATFLVSATERYGTFHAEVFALFVLHSAHDDEVDAVLRLLARDKQLAQTLALMPAVREELRARGLPLSGREGSEVPVQRVRLVYEGGSLKPAKSKDLEAAVREAEHKVPGVEVLFQ